MEFLRLMFQYVATKFPKQPSETSLTSIPNAIYALQQCSGMSRDHLANRLGLTRAKMIHLETYGKAPQTVAEKLRDIADEYELSELSSYFSNQILLVQARRRTKIRETTGQ